MPYNAGRRVSGAAFKRQKQSALQHLQELFEEAKKRSYNAAARLYTDEVSQMMDDVESGVADPIKYATVCNHLRNV